MRLTYLQRFAIFDLNLFVTSDAESPENFKTKKNKTASKNNPTVHQPIKTPHRKMRPTQSIWP